MPGAQHVTAVGAVFPHPRTQAVATPAGDGGQLLRADDPEADDDHTEAGDRHRRQRLPQQEPAAERSDDRADVEDQTRPGRADRIEQIEMQDVGERAGEHAEVDDRRERGGRPRRCGDRLASSDAEGVQQGRADRECPRGAGRTRQQRDRLRRAGADSRSRVRLGFAF